VLGVVAPWYTKIWRLPKINKNPLSQNIYGNNFSTGADVDIYRLIQ
jgi:hypothetical protein